tara:strand:- start:2158 stop:2535 length:378 start_codon:yes stop_codon:yes gene_type:complete
MSFPDKPLKFQNKFELLDVIKAYDFEPIDGDVPRYVVGVVMSYTVKGSGGKPGYAHYEIEVIASSHGQYKVDEIVYVPYETTMDFDGRIEKFIPRYAYITDKAIRDEVREDVELYKCERRQKRFG